MRSAKVWSGQTRAASASSERAPYGRAWRNNVLGGGSERAAAWVSADGIELTRVPDPFGDENWMQSVVRRPGGEELLAFGGRATWRATGGVSWTPSDSVDIPQPWSGAAWNGERVVAAGHDIALWLWSSTDGGATWSEIGRADSAFAATDVGLGVDRAEQCALRNDVISEGTPRRVSKESSATISISRRPGRTQRPAWTW